MSFLRKIIACRSLLARSVFAALEAGWEIRFREKIEAIRREVLSKDADVAQRILELEIKLHGAGSGAMQDSKGGFIALEKLYFAYYLPGYNLANEVRHSLGEAVACEHPEAYLIKRADTLLTSLENYQVPHQISRDVLHTMGLNSQRPLLVWRENRKKFQEQFEQGLSHYVDLEVAQLKALMSTGASSVQRKKIFQIRIQRLATHLEAHRFDSTCPKSIEWMCEVLGVHVTCKNSVLLKKLLAQTDVSESLRIPSLWFLDYIGRYELEINASEFGRVSKLLAPSDPKPLVHALGTLVQDHFLAQCGEILKPYHAASTEAPLDIKFWMKELDKILALYSDPSGQFQARVDLYGAITHYIKAIVHYSDDKKEWPSQKEMDGALGDFVRLKGLFSLFPSELTQTQTDPFNLEAMLRLGFENFSCEISGPRLHLAAYVLVKFRKMSSEESLTLLRFLEISSVDTAGKKAVLATLIRIFLEENKASSHKNRVLNNLQTWFCTSGQKLSWVAEHLMSEKEKQAVNAILDLGTIGENALKSVCDTLEKKSPLAWEDTLLQMEESQLFQTIQGRHFSCSEPFRFEVSQNKYFSKFIQEIDYNFYDYAWHYQRAMLTVRKNSDTSQLASLSMLDHIGAIKELIIGNSRQFPAEHPSHWKTVFYGILRAQNTQGIGPNTIQFVLHYANVKPYEVAVMLATAERRETAIRALATEAVLSCIDNHSGYSGVFQNFLDELPLLCLFELYMATREKSGFELTQQEYCKILEGLTGIKHALGGMEPFRGLSLLYWQDEIDKTRWQSALGLPSSELTDEILYMVETVRNQHGDPIRFLNKMAAANLTAELMKGCMEKVMSRKWVLIPRFYEELERVGHSSTDAFVDICANIQESFQTRMDTDLSLKEVVDMMIAQGMPEDIVKACEMRIIEAQRQQNALPLFTQEDFYLRMCQLKKDTLQLREDTTGVFAYVCKGIELWNDSLDLRANQKMAIMLFIHSETSDRGRLIELGTGEGKTLVAAGYALYLGLLGRHSDIHTSLKSLAEEAVTGLKTLYEDFFGIKVACNCDDKAIEDIQERRRRYKECQVIYGQTSDFQRDFLLTEFALHDAEKVMERYKPVAIVDEVDSEILDKGGHVLYLADVIPDFIHLDSLYLRIWEGFQLAPDVRELRHKNTSESIAQAKKLIKEYVHYLMQTQELVIPRRLQTFVHRRLDEWIENAFFAPLVGHDDNYVISPSVTQKRENMVVLIDKNTGQAMESTQWSEGLHQFVQLKHLRPISPETLKSVFLSTVQWFRSYGTNLVGMTGTLGTSTEQHLLAQVYNVDTVKVPRNRIDQFFEEQGIVVQTSTEQSEAINAIIDKARNEQRPILVFFETIREVNELEQFLQSQGKEGIITYTKSSDVIDYTMGPGQIVIATNLAGRGVNFELLEDVGVKKLLVIVGYIPPNQRVGTQAERRAARKGYRGSALYVVVDPHKTPLNRLKMQRDQEEKMRLHRFQKTELVKIEIEEALMKKFKEIRDWVQEVLKKENCNTEIMGLQLKYLGYRWSEWLDGYSKLLNTPEQAKLPLFEGFDVFKSQIEQDLQLSDNIRLIGNSPQGLIALGRLYQEGGYHQKAIACFERCIQTEPKFSGFAHYYCAASKIELDRSGYATRLEVKKSLKMAKHAMLAQINECSISEHLFSQFARHLHAKQEGDVVQRFTAHYQAIKSMLTIHLNAIDSMIGTSLQRIDLSRLGLIESTESKVLPKAVPESERSSKVSAHDAEALLDTDSLTQTFISEKIAKGFRLSKKLRIDLEKQELYLTSKYGPEKQIQFGSKFILFEKVVLEKLEKRLADNTRIVELFHLKDCVIGKSEYWKLLQDCRLIVSNKRGGHCWNPQVPSETRLAHPNLKKLSQSGCDQLQQTFEQDEVSPDMMPGFYATTETAKKALFRFLVEEEVINPPKVNIKLVDPSTLSWQDRAYQLYRYALINGKEDLFEAMQFQISSVTKETLNKALETASKAPNSKITRETRKDYQTKIEEYVTQLIESFRYAAGYLKSTGALKSDYRHLSAYFEAGSVPTELVRFDHLSMAEVIQMNESKSLFDPRALLVAIFGLMQVGAGILLAIYSGGALANVAIGLIGEGISDVMFAITAGLTKSFTWKSYAINKALSMTITVATYGIGLLASSLASRAAAKASTQVGAEVAADASVTVAQTATTRTAQSTLIASKSSMAIAKSIGKTTLTQLSKQLAITTTALVFDQALDQLAVEYSSLLKSKIKQTHAESQEIGRTLNTLKGLMTEAYQSCGEQSGNQLLEKIEKSVLSQMRTEETIAKVCLWMEKICNTTAGILSDLVRSSNNLAIRTSAIVIKWMAYAFDLAGIAAELANVCRFSLSIYGQCCNQIAQELSVIQANQGQNFQQARHTLAPKEAQALAKTRCDTLTRFVIEEIVKKSDLETLRSTFRSSVSGVISSISKSIELHKTHAHRTSYPDLEMSDGSPDDAQPDRVVHRMPPTPVGEVTLRSSIDFSKSMVPLITDLLATQQKKQLLKQQWAQVVSTQVRLFRSVQNEVDFEKRETKVSDLEALKSDLETVKEMNQQYIKLAAQYQWASPQNEESGSVEFVKLRRMLILHAT